MTSTTTTTKKAVPSQSNHELSTAVFSSEGRTLETTLDGLNHTPLPFLKWAGNKRKLLAQYAEWFPAPGSFQNYYEPFLGAGAVFLGFYAKWYLEQYQAGDETHLVHLSDANPRLINAWRQIQLDCESLLSQMCGALNWGEGWKSDYSDYRDRFNSEDSTAALFLWLNRHCFNGLYRENLSGEFNVPKGDYEQPSPPVEQITAVAPLLKGVDVSHQHYEWVRHSASKEDFVYFDPPYYPVSPSSFTSYDRKRFTIDDQVALAELFGVLTERRTKCALSNSDCEAVRRLYKGHRIIETYRSGNINSNPEKREKQKELLILNY